MKARPIKIVAGAAVVCPPAEAEYIDLRMPCPLKTRRLPINQCPRQPGVSYWDWNKDVDSPTIRPSILTRADKPKGQFVCHSWVTDGKVQFLSDSTHANAGKTLDLIDFGDEN